MGKCPDEKTLAEYLDYRLPSKHWDEVRAHCYFCDDCQRIVRISANAIRLRRERLGLSEKEERSEGPEALKLGILIQPPNDPYFGEATDKLSLKLLKEGRLYLDPEMNKQEYREKMFQINNDETIPSLGLSMKKRSYSCESRKAKK